MNYSLVYSGVITMFVVPLLGNLGFSEGCGGEIANALMMVPGAIMALYGRYRHGDVDVLGRKG